MSSNIEWTDESWNPSTGCTRISEGCRHCYAVDMARRLHAMGGKVGEKYDANFSFREHSDDLDTMLQPLRWKKPRRIFACSMSDLFHEQATDAHLDRVWAVMAACPQHTFQVLTKRPHRMAEYLRGLVDNPARWADAFDWLKQSYRSTLNGNRETTGVEVDALVASVNLREHGWPAEGLTHPRWPLANVWLGTSVESQDVTRPGWHPQAMKDGSVVPGRIDALLDCPAVVRFLSCEPLLGPLDLMLWLIRNGNDAHCANCGHGHGFRNGASNYGSISPTSGPSEGCSCPWCSERPVCEQFRRSSKAGIHWVIAGGESGKGARPCHPDWIRSLRDQCQSARVAFFFKQWGEWIPQYPQELSLANRAETYQHGHSFYRVGRKKAGRLLDGREWNEYPEVAAP